MVKVLMPPKDKKERVLEKSKAVRKPIESIVKKTARLWYGKVESGRGFIKNIRKEWAI